MPASQPPKSLQDILRQRQQSDFVGRDDYLNAFSHNLKVPLDDHQRRFLFNAWGQGGVGKSTLLKQFSKSAQDAGAAVAYTDESETSVPEAMGRLAEQFEQQGYKLGQFTERYRLFRQKKQELETDPEAPQGFSALVGKTMVKAGVKLGRRVPVGGAVLDFVDEEALSNQVSEWASFVAKKLNNKDDVQLVQEPVAVLTPLFLQDLCKIAQQVSIVLLFDTYEQTDEFLDLWLREVIEGKYGDVPPNIVITIAGREALDDNHWAAYDGLIARFPLEPFTEEEAKQYLHRKGVTNAKVVDVILQLSGRLPLLIATLAVGSPDSPDQVGEPSDTAVERFLKWVEDPKQRQIALDAALPRRFNRDIITQLAGEDDAEALFNWLKKMPFVKQQRDSWVYHQVVRAQMLRYQRLISTKTWEKTQAKLESYFDQCCNALTIEDNKQIYDPDRHKYAIEALYHALCSRPQKKIDQAINGFLAMLAPTSLKSKEYLEILHWVEAIDQAGQDSNNLALQDWGQQLLTGCMAITTHEFSKTVEMFSNIINSSILEEKCRSVALAWRGHIYFSMQSYEDALTDLNASIELRPDSEWSLRARGAIYSLTGNYQESLTDLTKAINLNPNNEINYAIRGSVYQYIGGNQKAALANLNHAINLSPNNEDFITHRGMLYLDMESYDEALVDFSRAIDLNSDNELAIIHRGKTLYHLKRYKEALPDLTYAIEIKSNDDLAITFRGIAYYHLNCYEEALIDLNYAVELEPNNVAAITVRGLAFYELSRFEEALIDLSRIIEFEPDNEALIVYRGIAYYQINHCEEAIRDLVRAAELKTVYSEKILALRDEIFNQVNRHKDTLTDLINIDAVKEKIKVIQQKLRDHPGDIKKLFSLALYYLADHQFELSQKTYQQGLIYGATSAQIRAAVQDLSEFLKLFPDHPQATAFYNGLRKKLESTS